MAIDLSTHSKEITAVYKDIVGGGKTDWYARRCDPEIRRNSLHDDLLMGGSSLTIARAPRPPTGVEQAGLWL